MGRTMLVIVAAVLAAYIAGATSASRRRKGYEDLRHQLERLWTSPEARNARKRMAKNAKRAAGRAAKSGRKTYARLAR